ncbi:MAG: hypothetical protein LBL73_00140, partial [Synergistaceae bacterium]|nr:hypothetical protein [Synergistaceae bacterium]
LCRPLLCLEKLDNMTLAGIAAREIEKFRPDAVFVDAGRGEGVIDRLRQLGHRVLEVNFGSRATDAGRYSDKRSEMWDRTREWLEAGGSIPNDAALKSDLTAPSYSFDAAGRMELEKKERVKARGLRSPDTADALALTFAFPVTPHTDGGKTAETENYSPFQWRKGRR